MIIGCKRTMALALALASGSCLFSAPSAEKTLLTPPAPPALTAVEKPYRGKQLRPARLHCEYRVDPMGIDVKRPRLSWIVESGARGKRQTAYRVLVASLPRLLKDGRADLWDSGRVTSDETIGSAYDGSELRSTQRCFWRVMVWDEDNQPSPWSKVASWSMGLLERQDWQAEWIGLDALREIETPADPLQGAQWIWFSDDSVMNAPAEKRVFMTTWSLPEDVVVESGTLVVTADDQVWFNLNGAQVAASSGQADAWRQALEVDVTSHLRPGDNTIRVQVQNSAVGAAGLLAKLTVMLRNGGSRVLVTDGSWRATDQPGANWHEREIAADAWPTCRVVGDYGISPWGQLQLAAVVTPPPAYLRTEFSLEKEVSRATLYTTAFGWCDTYLNGERVTEDRFDPGWTDYHKRIYYRAYDVTGLLRSGRNAWGAVLADGWYSGYIGWGKVREHYGSRPRFLGQLEVEYADHSKDVLVSNENWRGGEGPIQAADILMGEVFDARLADDDWAQPGFDDSKWLAVDVGAELSPVLQAHPSQPVRVIDAFAAQSISEPEPGVYVLDLGQNFAGVCRLKVKGEPGQVITLRFAERLNPDGTIYTTNLRTARATDTYICRGQGTEIWEPRFTFHGYQYVEIKGLKKRPAKGTVIGLALSSDTPVVGRFESSDPMLNQLHNNIYWTQRANFIDIPTDCPQRDERLGWTGDAQVYVRTATLNTDVQAFFGKWLVDLEDAQRVDGQFPQVAPVKVAGDDGGPAWSDAGVICPWTIYEVYGDRRVLERHYESMKRFIAFCVERSTPELLPPAQFHCFGDWLSLRADTPKDVIYTAYFAYSTALTAKTAEVLGKAQEAAEYRGLFERIQAAFNRAYVDADGRIKGDTQACYVLALAFDLLDSEKAKRAAEHLVADIQSRGVHLSTGFIGTKDLMLVLAKIGRNDVAYRLLNNDTFPSWGFSIQHGATSIWERWDGWTPDAGFQDPGMNSFAHYSFGAVYQWMVENIGGIRNDGVAYRKTLIAPQVGGGLTEATTRYRSVRGDIVSSWELEKGRLELEVEIPANTTATVLVPARSWNDVREGGKAVTSMASVRPLWLSEGVAALEIGSGRYEFLVPME